MHGEEATQNGLQGTSSTILKPVRTTTLRVMMTGDQRRSTVGALIQLIQLTQFAMHTLKCLLPNFIK